MKYKFISLVFFGIIYSQCSEMDMLQCNFDANCEWLENIEYGNCDDVSNGSDCYAIEECTWYSSGSYGYGFSGCYGGTYQINSSYCQESEVLQCSEMSMLQCNFNSNCEWVENLEIENCYDILDCTGGCTWQDCEAIEGCWWHFGTAYYDPSGCYGEHEEDNSYCKESDYIQGDLNGDLILNILDVIIIVDIILNQESSGLADINGDGIVNILDVIELVDIIINR